MDGHEIAERTFWERSRTLEIEGEIVNKPSKKENSFSLAKSNSYASVNSSDISYNQFPGSSPSCPQDLGHGLFIIREETKAPDKTINQGLQCITRDRPKECVSIEINDDLFAMVTNKGTESDSDCHQLTDTLRETISLFKDELMSKQVTINNLIAVIKNFTVIENKYARNKEHEANVGSKEKMMLLVSY